MAEVAGRLERELAKAIVGQQRVIREILIAFLAGGHCLLRGVPGLAKTLLIKKLAEAVDLKFNRIQFTPDLMPSDILGAEVIEEDRATGKRVIRFIRGPIFANILLADEINRTPPKTQAALLEAMQEYQVTVNGVRFELDRPLFVLATQNPIEQEGTYPLPEAQLDRFMFNVVIDYPTAEEERQILAATTGNRDPADRRRRVRRRHRAAARGRARRAGGRERHRLRGQAGSRDPSRRRSADDAARLRPQVGAMGRRSARGPGAAARRQGARAARRPQPSWRTTTSAAVALPVLRHRVLLNFQAEADEVDADVVILRLLERIREHDRDARSSDCCRRSPISNWSRESRSRAAWLACIAARSTATAPSSASIATTVPATI